MYAADIPSAIPMWASIRGQKHPGAAWQTGTCAGNARSHIGQFSDYRCDCLMTECRKVLKNNHIKIAC